MRGHSGSQRADPPKSGMQEIVASDETDRPFQTWAGTGEREHRWMGAS